MFELFVAHMGGRAPFSCNHVEQPGRTLFRFFLNTLIWVPNLFPGKTGKQLCLLTKACSGPSIQ